LPLDELSILLVNVRLIRRCISMYWLHSKKSAIRTVSKTSGWC